MRESRLELFRGRHFRDEVIVLCVRWYLRYPLSYRNLEEMMAERGLAVDLWFPGNPDLVHTLGVEPHPFRHPSFYVNGHSGSSARLPSHSGRSSD